jgi:4-diphosphocytidyl-2C-methyl-D-erythritol kinase
VGGEGENHLQRAAFAVEPRLESFAKSLPGWCMTGSGSAFFKPFASRKEAQAAVAGLDCWTAVAVPVPAWGSGS